MRRRKRSDAAELRELRDLLDAARKRMAKALKSGHGMRDASVAVRELTAAVERAEGKRDAAALESATPEERRSALKASLREMAARGKAQAGAQLAMLEMADLPRDIRIEFERPPAPDTIGEIARAIVAGGFTPEQIAEAVAAERHVGQEPRKGAPPPQGTPGASALPGVP